MNQNPLLPLSRNWFLIRRDSQRSAIDADTMATKVQLVAHIMPMESAFLKSDQRCGLWRSNVLHLVVYKQEKVTSAPEINTAILAPENQAILLFAPVVSWARTWVLSLISQKMRTSYEIRWLEKNWLIAYASLGGDGWHILWSDTSRQ